MGEKMLIRIDDAEITPNPVDAGGRFIIRVRVTEILQGISTSTGEYLETSGGLCIKASGVEKGGK